MKKNETLLVITLMILVTSYFISIKFTPDPIITVEKVYCKNINVVGRFSNGQTGLNYPPGVYEYCIEGEAIGTPNMDNYIPTPLFVQCMKAVEQHKDDICKGWKVIKQRDRSRPSLQ